MAVLVSLFLNRLEQLVEIGLHFHAFRRIFRYITCIIALKNAWENIGEVAFGGGVLRGLSKNL